MATITLMIGEPPYGRERVYTALRFSLAAIYEGHTVRLFLIEEAIHAARKGQEPQEMPGVMDQRMPNCGEMLKAVIAQGAEVRVCGVCAKERGITQDSLIEGAKIGSMRDLVNWVVASDRLVCF